MTRTRSRWWLHAPVLVAPDKFKGTMTASEVAAAIAAGLRDGGREADELPVADGGDGTAEVLLRALGGEWIEADATDALGRPITARFAMLVDGRAIVEAAEASGLARLSSPPDRGLTPDRRAGVRPLTVAKGVRPRNADATALDPWAASSRGTGELIVAAAEAGAESVIVAVGGTATMDGGAGALEAMADAGVRPTLVAVCDVNTPWERAAAVFGPQKGADSATVKRLGSRLARMAAKLPRDPRSVPFTGAGGALSGGLWAGADAKLVPGAPFVLDALGFDARMRAAAFVVTGEGKIDEQTLHGKAAGEVAVRCRQAGVACHAIVGRDELDDFSARVLALDSLDEAGDPKALTARSRELA